MKTESPLRDAILQTLKSEDRGFAASELVLRQDLRKISGVASIRSTLCFGVRVGWWDKQARGVYRMKAGQ